MANAITGIDHLLVGVDDLEGAARIWRRLGFTPTPPSRHRERPTGNCCLMFARDYLELIGIVDPAATAGANVALIRARGGGLFGAALATEDAEATHAGFAAAGLTPGTVAALSRVVERPEGEAEACFRLVELPPERTPEFRLLACQQLTPELLRRPAWLAHANGATAIASAIVAVAEPEALAPDLARIFGAGNVVVTDEILTVFVGPQRLLYARPDDLPLLLPEVALPAGLTPPRGVAIAFRCADIAIAAACLEQAGVGFDEPAEGHLLLAPDEAGGIVVEFTA